MQWMDTFRTPYNKHLSFRRRSKELLQHYKFKPRFIYFFYGVHSIVISIDFGFLHNIHPDMSMQSRVPLMNKPPPKTDYWKEVESFRTPESKAVAEPPVVGSQAPSSNKLTLLDNRPLLLVFLRHCGCPCKSYSYDRAPLQQTLQT